MRFFKEASELAACGFQVFPIEPSDDCGQFRNFATDDLASLSLWDQRSPLCDVALLLGEASDVVLVHVSPDGFSELRALEALGLHVPSCPVAQASDGEATLWFRNVIGFDGVRMVAPGLIALGEGQIWRAPPSHDRTGGYWRWVVPPWEVKPAVLPAWLLARIVPRRGVFRALRI